MDNYSFSQNKYGGQSQVSYNAAQRMIYENYSSLSLGEKTKKVESEELPYKGKFDLNFLNKFLIETDTTIKSTHEFNQCSKNYKLAVSKFCKTVENDFLTNLQKDTKDQVFRDISRIYSQQPEAQQLKDKIRKILTYKLEDTRRNLQDNKWNLTMNLLHIVLNKNHENKDCFDLLQKKDIPNELRQMVWKFCLENPEASKEYFKQLNDARIFTVSKMDVQIIKDCEAFIASMVKPDDFDGSMLYAMKTILSYYEVKKDRVLTDYLYLIALPLVFTFGSAKHMLTIPTDLVGYFFTLQSIVSFYDPLVDLIVQHGEEYDSSMTDLFLNSLEVIDKILIEKIKKVLNLQQASQRTLLVLVIKRFIHSLGFAFLPMKITLFVWDQIFMKIIKHRVEIFVVMSISFFCLREKIIACKDWDQIVDVYYQLSKYITYEEFKGYYLDVFKNVKFYVSPYNVDPKTVNRNAELSTDALSEIVDKQYQDDIKAYKKKWVEGQEYYQEDENLKVISQRDKAQAVNQIKLEDALKNVGGPRNNKINQNLGMVQFGSEDEENQDILNDFQ